VCCVLFFVSLPSEKKGEKGAASFHERQKKRVTSFFCFGIAELKKGNTENISFLAVIDKYTFFPFHSVSIKT